MMEAQGILGGARDRILEAVERVVADVGAARLTLDLVAQAAGVSKGGLLYHFPSKESLFSALAHRYVESMDHCINSAKCDIGEGDAARELKACVLGFLGTDRRSKAMASALLAAAVNDPTVVDVVRNHVAQHTDELIAANANFARAAIVTLAVDGLKLRELLRISSFTDEQREQIVKELLKMADEAYG